MGSSDDCNDWMLNFFTKLETNDIGSLTLKKNPADGFRSKFSLSDEAFSAICSWIKIKGEKLKRVIFEEVKYLGKQPNWLKSALVARKDQLEYVEIVEQNKAANAAKMEAL